jgi:ATP-dependent Clp protease ATP-binding subunit ClpA
MLRINPLFKQVNDSHPGCRITLTLALQTWAETPDWQDELAALLEPCGLGLAEFLDVLSRREAIETPQSETILSRALVEGWKGQPLAAALLAVLVGAPHHPLTRGLVHVGLDLQCLRSTLDDLPTEPDLLETVLSPTEHRMPILAQYGRNLTDLARAGVFDGLHPRPQALESLVLVLLKTQKGNAVITGPAGAGKTALVALLARAIAAGGSVPDDLLSCDVVEVSLSRLLAGTIYRGQFEERLENLLAEVQQYPETILFIDELHLLWGAGRTSHSAMDAANILKPALARGEVRLIGATTAADYHRYLAADEALARRFEVIPLAPPQGALLQDLIFAAGRTIGRKTGVVIDEAAAAAAIRLSDRYLPQRSQPDKAVNLLDLAAARARVMGLPAVGVDLLRQVLAEQTGQLITTLDGGGRESLLALEDRIKRRLIGQAEAVRGVVQTLIYRRQMMEDNGERNLGTFLFAGPTGVGKTELGRILADLFYGGPERLLLLDLAEYTHGASVSRLIGAAPGLVGHEQPGLLGAFLQRVGGGVIIFDEIEKAHPDVRDFLLGILDNGRVRTGRGETLSTRACVVIVTTNVLKEDDLTSPGFGFAGQTQQASPAALLGRHFPPEFLGRFDALILFHDLSTEDLRAIVNLRLDEALAAFKRQGIQVHFEREALVNAILAQLSGGGARGVARAVEKLFSQPAAIQSLLSTEVTLTPADDLKG